MRDSRRTAGIPRMTGIAFVVGLISSWVGLVVSYHENLPPGPVIILVAGVFHVASMLFGRAGGWLRRLPGKVHLEA